MTTRTTSLVVGMLLNAPHLAFAQAVPQLPAHEIVMQKTVDALPDDLAPLFRHNIDQLKRFVTDPANVWPGDKKLRHRNRWHHVDTDIETHAPTRDARAQAANSFPRDKTAAQRLYRKLSYHRGGLLPWGIEECYRELVAAFQTDNAEVVLAKAAHVAHFAADIADPFRCATRATGHSAFNLKFGHARAPHGLSQYHSVSERWSVGLLTRRSWDYTANIALTSDDYQSATDPLHAAFETILTSLNALDPIAQADRDILQQLAVTDQQSFEQHREEYYRELHDRCAGTIRGRLHAGAKLAAGLIGGAWQVAGRPSVEEIRSRGESIVPADVTDPDPDVAAQFVGSKKSVVFHRTDCRFASRIAAGNLVKFQNPQDALRQGRRPCKTCRPRASVPNTPR